MNAPKKSDPLVEELIPLVEALIAKEPHEALGLQWAARPQDFYCEKLGVSEWTLRRRIRKPPFVTKQALVDGKKLCLLRLGEAPPKDIADEAKRVTIKLWNLTQDRRVKWKEGQCLWGMTKDMMKLLTELGITAEQCGELAIAMFKHAISAEGWKGVMVFVKQRAKELPDGVVRYYRYPSIGVIRLFWKEALYAYFQAAQAGEAKHPEGDEDWKDFVKPSGDSGKLMALLDEMIWIDSESEATATSEPA